MAITARNAGNVASSAASNAASNASGNATKSKVANADALFAWEGRDRNGKAVKGDMRASGPAGVSVALRRQGITAVKVRRRKVSRLGNVKEKDVAIFTRQLSTMMKAGVPLLQSFDIVARGDANPAMAKLINEVRQEVETGASMHQAFRRFPLHFDALYCNLVEAGEQAGILEDLLERLATYKEKTLAIKGKIKSAMFYPVSILAVALIVTAVIMIWVVPAFKKVFESFGADLPAPTLFVMAVSDFTVQWWYVIFGSLFAGLYTFFHVWKRSAAMQRTMDRLLLRLPIFGNVIRKATIARWTRTLSTMFAAGVPLVDSLESVGGAAGNVVYLDATRKIQTAVSTGTSLTQAMMAVDVFPNMVIQMVAIGEESGALDEMLGKVAGFYEAEVDQAVDSLSSLMEPLIMVILGVLIGGLVVAMYLPIFKLGSVV